MKEIYFGPVSRFYDAEEVMIPSATYRKSTQDSELDYSLRMLKQHLSGYFSTSSASRPSDKLSSGASRRSCSEESALDEFFR